MSKTRQTGKKEKYAYTIKDIYFDDLNVLNTANAWWLDKTKVDSLIREFKIGATIKETCVSAGISKRQYDYFNELHKDFCIIKEALEEIPTLTARREVIKGLEGNPEFSLKYLERKKKAEFSPRTELTGADGDPIAVTGFNYIKPNEDNNTNDSAIA